MEENLSTGSDNKLPLFIGLGAIGVALIALVLAFKARGDAKTAKDELAKVAESYATKSEVDSVRASAAKTSDVTAVSGALDEFKGQVTTNFNALAGTVNEQNKLLQGIAKRPATGSTASTSTGSSAPVAGAGEYIVKSGDTPRKIATAAGVTVNDLLKANPGLNPTKMKIGQKLQLPKK